MDALLAIKFVDIVQILAIVFTVIYILFAVLILRQAQLMVKTIFSPISPAVLFLAVVHIGVALAALLLLVGVI